MTAITADELSHRTEDVLRRVRDEGETIEIVEGSAVVARLVPASPAAPAEDEDAELNALWDRIARVAEEKTARLRWDGSRLEITHPPRRQPTREEMEAIWAERRRLAREISAHWPKGVSAVQAIDEDRREL